VVSTPSGETYKQRLDRELKEGFKRMKGEPTITKEQARAEVVALTREMADGFLKTILEEDVAAKDADPVRRADYALHRAATMDLIKHLREFK
jgi:hypothetical protein